MNKKKGTRNYSSGTALTLLIKNYLEIFSPPYAKKKF